MGKSPRDRARAAESTLNSALRHTHHRPEARYAMLGPTASTSTSSGHPDMCLHEHRPHPPAFLLPELRRPEELGIQSKTLDTALR